MLNICLQGILCGIFSRNFSMCFQIEFVAHENDGAVVDGAPNFANPAFRLVQSFDRGDVLDDYSRGGSTIVHRS